MPVNPKTNGYCLDWSSVKRDWPCWLIMILLLALAVWVYPRLPAQVPGHWNMNGEVDRYVSRSFGAFFPPLLAVGLYVLMLVVPLADPRRDNYVCFAEPYRLVRWGIVLFLGGLYLITILAGLGYEVNTALAVKTGISLLFILIGNLMGQLRHNYFVGVRTPWTLASEEVWQRTHRLGGRVWVGCGFVGLLTAPLQGLWGVCVFFATLAVMVVVPIAFSYLDFNRRV